MCSKEKEPETPVVYFKTWSVWHLVPLEQAKGHFGKLDFSDWQSVREVWLYGPSKATSSTAVAGIFKDRGVAHLTQELIEKLPPGSYIFPDGKIVSKE